MRWRAVLAATTGFPRGRGAVDAAASVGARVVVGESLGAPVDLDAVNPVIATADPDPELVERYEEAREDSDALARAVLDLNGP
jgi:hypothetical protein